MVFSRIQWKREIPVKLKKLGFALGSVLLFASAQASAQSGLAHASSSPISKQLYLEFKDGTVVLADEDTQTIYIVNESGQKFEVSFAQAVADAEPDPAKRADRLAEFRASLTDYGHMVTLAPTRIATDDSIWQYTGWCGDVVCIDPFGVAPAPMQANSITVMSTASQKTCNHYLCPQTPFPCEAGPCGPNQWGDGLTLYSGFLAGWGDDKGGGTVTQQELVAYDKGLWERERNQACTDKNVATAETAAVGAGTTAACFLAETGVGALVCAGGIITYGIGLYKIDKLAKQCQGTYPGIGNW